MNTKLLLTTVALASLFNANAENDPVLMKINNKDVRKSEFEYIYNKNTNQQMVEQKDLKEYVDLFVNFKLKVAEAEAQGIDTLESFITELKGYRQQLAQPYLIDSSVDDALAMEAYQRLTENVEASHILIKLDPNASAEQEKEVYEKLMKCKKEIMAGKDFALAAREISDCPSKEKGGYLGYFGGFSMVYAFESAAYNTPVGEVSDPFRTNFGYHIVKVTGRRADRGEVLTAHIMKRVPQNATPAVWESAKKEIDQIYAELEQGADFAQEAKTKSDDQYSASNGGEYPWFGANRMPVEYEDAAFGISQKGAYSKPFRTQVGWHVVKLIDKRGVASFESMKEDITKRLARDEQRKGKSEEALIDKLKKDYNLTFGADAQLMFDSLLENNSPVDSLFLSEIAKKNEIMFTIAGKRYMTSDFANFIDKNRRSNKTSDRDVFEEKKEMFVRQSVLDYEDTQLEVKYADFRNLINEYRDGILLFEVSNREVWEKASSDIDGLQSYFKKNKKNYKWDAPKYKGHVVRCSNDSIAKVAKNIIKKAPSDSIAIYLRRELNNDTEKNVVVMSGLYAKGDNKYVDALAFKGEAVEDEQYPVVFLQGKTLKSPVSYEDVRGLVTSDYQNYLEKSWIESLKAKYPVEIYQDVLNTVKPL